MSKSQNTKNEQQKDLCITSELTEQLKKGELKLGEHYYYTTIFSPTVYIQNFTRDVVSFQDFKETVAEVLAPVPSYEEWQAKLEENKRLKHDVGNLGYKIKNQRHEIDNRLKEIEKLKELLKKCVPAVEQLINSARIYKLDTTKTEELLTKIDEVLK